MHFRMKKPTRQHSIQFLPQQKAPFLEPHVQSEASSSAPAVSLVPLSASGRAAGASPSPVSAELTTATCSAGGLPACCSVLLPGSTWPSTPRKLGVSAPAEAAAPCERTSTTKSAVATDLRRLIIPG